MIKTLKARLAAVGCAAMLAATALAALPVTETEAQAVDTFSISVNGENVTADSLSLGMVSANGSSRLLLDYKSQNEAAYWELIDQLFNKETGIGLTHIKLEFGSDVDSSSGSEPATKRTETETADVTRGAGFQLAADIVSVYPDVSVDLLQWGEPNFAHESFYNRYRWYKETLDAAYDTYGLKFDYVSACPNESGVDSDNIRWIKYFRNALNNETDGRYDYSAIKLVAADEVTTAYIADYMLTDEELRNAIDVIGIHYSTWSSDNALKLKNEYGKEIWYSEGTAVCIDPEYGKNATTISGLDSTLGDDGGLTGTNGALEIAARILNMYPQGGMTMYEFQPAIASYYYGSVYTPKQLITANTPWSGYYKTEVGAAIAAQFTRFLTDNMTYVSGACYGDGTKNTATGDGHGLVNTTNNYITLADSETGDYTMIFVNDSETAREYNVSVSNLAKSDSTLSVWTTSGSDASGWLAKTGEITPENGSFTVTVEPYSMVTLTTLTGQKSFSECQTSSYQDESLDTDLALPYSDNYNYSEKFLSTRGNAPLYNTDVSGSFEVQTLDGEQVLMNMTTYEEHPYGWGSSSNAYTTQSYTQVGDDSWTDYKVSADVYFSKNASGKIVNYVALGARYTSTDSQGYVIKLYSSGKWQALKNLTAVSEGGISGFDSTASHKLKVKVIGSTVSYYVDNALVYSFTDSSAQYTSGRAAMFSAQENNAFDNLSVEPLSGGASYSEKTDALDDAVAYSGSWALKAGDSYKYNNRTRAVSSESGAAFEATFTGTGVSLLSGSSPAATISVEIDGVAETVSAPAAGVRQASYVKRGLSDGEHTLKVTAIDGEYTLDTIEAVGAVLSGTDSDPDDGNTLTSGIDIKNAVNGTASGELTYDGAEKYPTLPDISYNGTALVEGTDYVVTYSDNVSAGKKTKVYITGIGNYYGTVELTYKIDKRTLPDTIKVDCCLENGTLVFGVYDTELGLWLDSDSFKVSGYDESLSVGDTGTVKITGRTNYTGSQTVSYTVGSHSFELVSSVKIDSADEVVNTYRCTNCGEERSFVEEYTDPAAEPSTDPATEPSTDPVTEPASDTTEPSSAAATAATEAVTAATTTTTAAADETSAATTAASTTAAATAAASATVAASTTEAAASSFADDGSVNTGAAAASGIAILAAAAAAAIATTKRKK